MRVVIKDRVEPLMDRAINAVSEGGTMKFTVRNLFYKIRELFLTENFVCPICGNQVKLLEFPDTFICGEGHTVNGDSLRPLVPGLRFYLYDSFSQDFITAYEKNHEKVEGMLREERGKLSYPDYDIDYNSYEEGIDTEAIDTFTPGVGNKVIMVEKLGLFHMMRANNFDRRLDAILVSTEGFSTEAARLIMVGAAAQGLPVCILHDYDINGLLIFETLLQPTKRRDSFINGRAYDLGFTYEQLRGFGKRPEPVELKKASIGKLAGLLRDGKVTEEEYNFLLRYRVELNALTPLELLRWLEAELERRDLWKTIPDEDELREEAESRIRAELWVFSDSLASSVAEVLLEEFGLDRVQELIDEIRDYAESKAKEWINLPEVESKLTVDELVERLREKQEQYWKDIAKQLGSKEALDFKDELESQVDGEREDWVDEISKDETVTIKLEELKQLLS